jgi:hypothetical protein
MEKMQNKPQFSVRKREKNVYFFNWTLRLGYIKGGPARPSGAELLTATQFSGGT